MYKNPRKIFNIPEQKNTFIELDPEKPYIAGEDGYQTKCAWSPFNKWELFGKVESVLINKKPIVVNKKMV
jgi:carbamoyl-phosphate synthase/aspartate carbamoyltransferase/dihydroorotase